MTTRHTTACGADRLDPVEGPRFRVADVLRDARDGGFIDVADLTGVRAKTLHAICHCQTAALGGHAVVCQDCHHVSYAYNSCRNRHCPQCQWSAQRKWIAGRMQRLLDTHYFHVVFTVPDVLRPLALCQPRQVYGLMLQSAGHTLTELGRDRYLQADLGVTAVLHTWARNLTLHPHVHCLVTGGGLSLDGSRWMSARPGYLFSVQLMAALFRGKMVAGLRTLFERGELDIERTAFEALVDRLCFTEWNVYAKRPMAGPEQVIRYLGAYTHRVAISDWRILDVTYDSVSFKTRGEGRCTLSLAEFTRRFLLHVLPSGFTKIRHYGLFAAANVNTKWAKAHALRPVESDDTEGEADEPAVLSCEACGSTSVSLVELDSWEFVVSTTSEARGPPVRCQSGRTP